MTKTQSDHSDQLPVVTQDPLANYSARDLITAIHWTSKDDLQQCIDNNSTLHHLWKCLTKVDLGIEQFHVSELVKIMERNKDQSN